MPEVKMCVWGYGSCWNLDFLYSEKETTRLEKKIENGKWDFETYGQPEMAFESGVNISPSAATLFVEDSKGKEIFKTNIVDLPYHVFKHEYVILENGLVCSDKDFYALWHYDETAKGTFFELEPIKLPKTGFDVEKLEVTVKHFIREGEEVLSFITDIAYDDHLFESEPGVDFKGGGSLRIIY